MTILKTQLADHKGAVADSSWSRHSAPIRQCGERLLFDVRMNNSIPPMPSSACGRDGRNASRPAFRLSILVPVAPSNFQQEVRHEKLSN